MEVFSFLNKETFEALPLTRWFDKSGHPIPGYPELLVEKAAEIKILVEKELSCMNMYSLSLLDKSVQVTTLVISDADAGWIIGENSD